MRASTTGLSGFLKIHYPDLILIFCLRPLPCLSLSADVDVWESVCLIATYPGSWRVNSASSVLPPSEDPELVADASALALAYGHVRGIELTLDGGEGSLRPSTVIDLVDSSAPVVVRE